MLANASPKRRILLELLENDGISWGMRYFSIRFIIACITLFFLCNSVAYAMNADEAEHARNSFQLLQKKDWAGAVQQAKETNDDALQSLVLWEYLLDAQTGASFYEITNFIEKRQDWPEQHKLRIRAEMSLQDASLTPDEIVDWFAKDAPITGMGKIAVVKALLVNGKQPDKTSASLVREAWRDGDFDESQEKSLLASYGNLLLKSDDIARTDRLLWEEKNTQAIRMLPRVDDAHKKLYKARISLQAQRKDVAYTLSQVPKNLRNDIGLLYDRMIFRAKHGEDAGVREVLLAAPAKIPYPEKWWKYRDTQIRGAMADNNVKLASQLLANHGQEQGQSFTKGFAEASWLRGRLLLKYQNRPKEAYKVFYKMFDEVKYPVSKARAAYWAAKSAQKSGDTKTAQIWLEKATAYPTSFYGQIAAFERSGLAPLHIPASPNASVDERTEFESRSVVRAIKICLEFNQPAIAEKLIGDLVENAENGKEAMLASELGTKAGKHYLSVRGAKKAMQNNMILIEAGYPTIDTPENLAVPRALALSITRQESEFDNFAKSSSGAMGLMQLLPSTARETAQKNGLGFDAEQLYEPAYNVTLGSLYLRHLVDVYDGRIPMAVAAYNAGAGNVHKWIQKFGNPNNTDAMVDWIENIPFYETRNYVQRVMENLQIYRHIETEDGVEKLQIGADLGTR